MSARPQRLEVVQPSPDPRHPPGGYDERTFFLLPVGAGTELTGPGGDGFLSVITPASPVGRALMGRRAGDCIEVTLAGEVHEYSRPLEAKKIAIVSSKLAYVPKNKKSVSGRDAEVRLNLVEALDEHDDVQNVFGDFDLSEEELQRIAAM